MPYSNSYILNKLLPSNPLFVHTPESLVANSAGAITYWNDISGNGYIGQTSAGSCKIDNQNSLPGLKAAVNTSFLASVTNTNEQTYTCAFLVQRSLITLPASCYLHYSQGLTSGLINYIVSTNSQISFSFQGSTATIIGNPSYYLGNYLFVIVRYNAGDLNYYINNCNSNSSIVKTSTPSFITETWQFNTKVSNAASSGYITNFEAVWNRSLTDAECLQISQYAYLLSGGQVGDNPQTLSTTDLNKVPSNPLIWYDVKKSTQNNISPNTPETLKNLVSSDYNLTTNVGYNKLGNKNGYACMDATATRDFSNANCPILTGDSTILSIVTPNTTDLAMIFGETGTGYCTTYTSTNPSFNASASIIDTNYTVKANQILVMVRKQSGSNVTGYSNSFTRTITGTQAVGAVNGFRFRSLVSCSPYELIGYNRALTDIEIQQLFAYAYDKYGVAKNENTALKQNFNNEIGVI